MSWTFPAAWEEALWAAAAERLPPEALDIKAVAAAAEERSAIYTTERDRLAAREKLRPRDLAARALFFTPSDAPKASVAMAELAGRGLVPAHRPLRVLDFGAGCGAMTLGIAAALPGVPLAVHPVDIDREALAFMAAAVARIDAPIELVGPHAQHDLVIAGTVLNELAPADRRRLVESWMASLAPDGACILVEPALRDTTRALHELRDALIAAGTAHVFAPCTRHAAPCPMLADPRDWCHEDRAFDPPPRLTDLCRRTGLRRGRLKFSYMTLRREPTDLVVAPPGHVALRVVSDELRTKGATERFVCGDAGRERLRLLKRHRDDGNRDLDRADRGDVLLRELGEGDAPLRVTRVRPAGAPSPSDPDE